jgi:hypothetical protein
VLVLAGATAIVLRKNRTLDRQNAEIAAQKTEVENQKRKVDAKIRESDQLAGKVYLERALEREKVA